MPVRPSQTFPVSQADLLNEVERWLQSRSFNVTVRIFLTGAFCMAGMGVAAIVLQGLPANHPWLAWEGLIVMGLSIAGALYGWFGAFPRPAYHHVARIRASVREHRWNDPLLKHVWEDPEQWTLLNSQELHALDLDMDQACEPVRTVWQGLLDTDHGLRRANANALRQWAQDEREQAIPSTHDPAVQAQRRTLQGIARVPRP